MSLEHPSRAVPSDKVVDFAKALAEKRAKEAASQKAEETAFEALLAELAMRPVPLAGYSQLPIDIYAPGMPLLQLSEKKIPTRN